MYSRRQPQREATTRQLSLLCRNGGDNRRRALLNAASSEMSSAPSEPLRFLLHLHPNPFVPDPHITISRFGQDESLTDC
jgi:hypothetical protein